MEALRNIAIISLSVAAVMAANGNKNLQKKIRVLQTNMAQQTQLIEKNWQMHLDLRTELNDLYMMGGE